MARIIDAFSQFFDGNGDPLASGYLNFFQNNTAIEEQTYNDPEQTELNPTNVPLDGEGRLVLNTYANVLCTVSLHNTNGAQVSSYDDVTPRGGLTSGFAFALWDSSINYEPNVSIVTGSDDNYYKSKTSNTSIDPVVDIASGGENWERVSFNEFWSSFKTYSVGAKVSSLVTLEDYISLSIINLDNDPTSDDGTNWVLDRPALNWAIGKTYEIDEESYSLVDNRRYKSVISQTGNEPSVDDGTNWLPTDGVVTTPVNLLPADSATDVIKTPLLTTEDYEITGSSNEQEWIQHQLSTDSFATVSYDSGITRDFTGHTVETSLLSATTYSYRAKTKGVRTDITDFSTVTTFSTVPDLSEVFAINRDTGTGVARFAVTNVDLFTQSGSIWIYNRDITSFVKKIDTSRGTEEFDLANNTPEATNTQGVTSFAVNGFNIGTDTSYNGSGNIISSFTYQNSTGFHGTTNYVGNGVIRSLAHNVGTDIAALIIKNKNRAASSFTYFYLWHKDAGDVSIAMKNSATSGSVFGTVDSSSFGLSADSKINLSGDNYICELFADNATQGTTGGTYVGTGSAGLKVTTGFPVGVFYSNGISSIIGTLIADIKSGTTSHIECNDSGNTEVAGSVASFDSDGVTLDSNDFNIAGITYYWWAQADPDQF